MLKNVAKKILQFKGVKKVLLFFGGKQWAEYVLLKLSGTFDKKYYLRKYPEIISLNASPLMHYIKEGAREYYNPNYWFSTKAYLESNKSKVGKTNPLLHFIICSVGKKSFSSSDYKSWVKLYDTLSFRDRKKIRNTIREYDFQPKISIVLPTYNSNVVYLERAINSVRKQLYSNWELCIADDNSTNSDVVDFLKGVGSEKIKVVFRKDNGHISAASNSALKMATGEFVTFLDHDDELREHALFEIVTCLNNNPKAELIYSDEDKIDSKGNRYDPYFKSDWNKDLLYSQNYINHIAVYKREIVEKVGGLRQGFEGSQDHDLLLRYIEQIDEKNIAHIPKVLYHWRAVEGSTAIGIQEKNYAVQAGVKAINSHFERLGLQATAEIIYGSQYRVKWDLPSKPPKVSIIIPFRDKVNLLQTCVEGILNKTDYPNLEVLLVNNNSTEESTHEYLKTITSLQSLRVIDYDHPFNYSAINNFAVKESTGDILCLLNNDIEIIHSDWLTEMVSHACRKEVGAVGAKLYFPDDTIQHTGVILGIGGIAGHIHKYTDKHDRGYMNKAALIQNFSAVTAACMVLRKEVFEEVGGLNETDLKVAFNDIDFCLKIREVGYNIVFTPFAELYHHESKTRGNDTDADKVERFNGEMNYMRERWGDLLQNDPYFNPNFGLINENYELAFP